LFFAMVYSPSKCAPQGTIYYFEGKEKELPHKMQPHVIFLRIGDGKTRAVCCRARKGNLRVHVRTGRRGLRRLHNREFRRLRMKIRKEVHLPYDPRWGLAAPNPRRDAYSDSLSPEQPHERKTGAHITV
jgi:hypothetical protein